MNKGEFLACVWKNPHNLELLHRLRDLALKDCYLVACTCVGIRVDSGGVYAPDGFDDLSSGILRINPINVRSELFQKKAESYQARWNWLTIAS